MAIEDRNLTAGTRLTATYRKVRYVCTVEAEGEEGKLAFVLEDGKRFKSPSSAASAVMGGAAANGWRFWSLEGSTPAAPAADAAESAPKERKAGGTRTRTKRAPPEAPQPEGGDYLIDSDGRPVNQSKTSVAIEGEEQADADRPD